MTELIEVADERFIVSLLYNTKDHLLGYPVYQEFGLDRCYAHTDLHEKLMRLPAKLKELKLKLVIYDIYRPLEVQKRMWEMLPDPRYVADPAEGSHHNRAVAVDCYLAREDGTKLEFPTTPDGHIEGLDKDFDAWMAYLAKAHHTYEGTPEEQEKIRNRDLLRGLMEEAGFASITEEWWHYELPNAFDYPVIENYRPLRMSSAA